MIINVLTDGNEYALEILENSRLAKYIKECPQTLTMTIFPFMRRIFDECEDFLRTTFQFTFPQLHLEIVCDPEKWVLWRKWAEEKERREIQ